MVFVKQVNDRSSDEVEVFNEVIVWIVHVIIDINPFQLIIFAEVVPFLKVVGDGDGKNLQIVVVGEFFVKFIQFWGFYNTFVAVGIPKPQDNVVFVDIAGRMFVVVDVVADQGGNGFPWQQFAFPIDRTLVIL